MTTLRNRTEACPIEELMDILAGRWKVFILWELIQGPRRSGELRKSIPPITQKVFVEQLRDLEDNGLVKRTVFPTVPPRVEYEATPLGHSLRDILKGMCHWSSENMEKVREFRRTRRLEQVGTIERLEAATSYHWFPASILSTPRLPALVAASKQPFMTSAKVVQTIDLGNRLPIGAVVEENILGVALHAIFAAQFTNPQHSERMIAIKRILGAYNLDHSVKADDVAVMLDRFAAQLDKLFPSRKRSWSRHHF